MILTPDRSIITPARCARCGRFRIRSRRRIAPHWRGGVRALSMANGDRLLDTSGNVILDTSGNVVLDNGGDMSCCCGGTPTPEPCACSNCTNDSNLMACCWRFDLAGVTTCPGYPGLPNGNGSYPLWPAVGGCGSNSGAYDMSGAAVPVDPFTVGSFLHLSVSRGAANKFFAGASYPGGGGKSMYTDSPGGTTVASCFSAFGSSNVNACGGLIGGSGGTATLTPIACPWATVCDQTCDTRCTGCSYCLNGSRAKITIAAATMTGCTGGTCAGSSIGGGVFTTLRPSLYSAGAGPSFSTVSWSTGLISGWSYRLVRNCAAGTWTLTITGAGGCAFENTTSAQGCLAGNGTLTAHDGAGHTCTVSGGAWSAVIQTNGNC